MNISMIVAASSNNIIGINNKLPWHLPKDLAYFKKITSGNTIIMGRKTYDSIGFPLPNRVNIVVTRNKDYKLKDDSIKVACSLEKAIKIANEIDSNNKETFIIGGNQIFKEALEKEMVSKIYLNRVLVECEGDTFLPRIDWNVWDLASKNHSEIDSSNKFAIDYCIYNRK